MGRFVEGRYRGEASEHRPARAYVIDGAKASFLTERPTAPGRSSHLSRRYRLRTNIMPSMAVVTQSC
jgi:hypothetical protein